MQFTGGVAGATTKTKCYIRLGVGPIRESTKIGDPNLDPRLVGFLYNSDPNKVPLI